MEKLENKITFDELPHAVTYLINEVKELKELVKLDLVSEPEKRRLICLSEASQVIGKAKATIYGLVCRKAIPYYKKGNQLYFYEDELIAYIESGKNGARTAK